MAKTNDPNALSTLARGLLVVADRLEAKEAARVCAAAAATLTQAMTKTNDDAPLDFLARGLSAVAVRLEPKDAAEAAATLTQAMTKTNDAFALNHLARGLSAVAVRLEAKDAAEAAATLTQAMTKTNDALGLLTNLAQGLSAVLGNAGREKRAEAVAATVGCLHDCQGLPGAVLLLRPAAEPYPRRFSDQQLVDLLKHPLCVGEARRIVLDQLGLQHQRTFADQWEFVRFAEEQKLGLDFTSPPKRPEYFLGEWPTSVTNIQSGYGNW
jgi:hypothetical protein